MRALEADVIGPFDPETGEEVLRLPPSRWYLTGFLAPQGGRDPVELQDPTAEEELGTEIDHDEESGGTADIPQALGVATPTQQSKIDFFELDDEFLSAS